MSCLNGKRPPAPLQTWRSTRGLTCQRIAPPLVGMYPASAPPQLCRWSNTEKFVYSKTDHSLKKRYLMMSSLNLTNKIKQKNKYKVILNKVYFIKASWRESKILFTEFEYDWIQNAWTHKTWRQIRNTSLHYHISIHMIWIFNSFITHLFCSPRYLSLSYHVNYFNDGKFTFFKFWISIFNFVLFSIFYI